MHDGPIAARGPSSRAADEGPGPALARSAGSAPGTPSDLERRYDVFLCHNSNEKPLVKDIADHLQIEAGVLFFLDEFSIPPSVEFMRYIRAEMSRSASCAIFLGPSGWGKTHIEEARMALAIQERREDYRIIPVLLPGCDASLWGEVFGQGNGPRFNWVRFEHAFDAAARANLLEAVHGEFPVKASGPEAVTPYYIRRQAALWTRSGGKDDSLLLRGELLREAQRQAAANPLFVTSVAEPFLKRCEAAERNGYRRRIGIAATAAVVATALSVVAFVQRQEARRAASVALARSLAAAAPRTIGTRRDDELAVLLARQAYLIDESQGGPSASLTNAALSEVLGTPFISSVFRLPTGAIASDVSATGRFLVAEGDTWLLIGPIVEDGGGRPRVPPTTTPLGDAVSQAVFDRSADALWIATKDGRLVVRDPNRPHEERRVSDGLGGAAKALSVAAAAPMAVALVGDGTLVAVDLDAGTSRRWDVPRRIRAIEIAPRGDRIAVAYAEDRERLDVLDIGSAAPRWSFPGDDAVNAFAFDPRTGDLIVGERGGKTWRWSPGGTPVTLGPDWPGSIDAVAVSADGRLVLASSGAAAAGIQLWDAAEGDRRTVIEGPRGGILLKATRDDRFIVSAGLDREVRYWRVDGSGAQRSARADTYQPFPLQGRLYAVARAPGSDDFLVGGDHGVLQSWPSAALDRPPRVLADERVKALSSVPDVGRFENGGRNYLLTGHVMALAFSGDGSRFATVDPYGYALVFPAGRTGATPMRIDPESTSTPTFTVALNNSGRLLAVGFTANLTMLHALGDDGSSVARTPLPRPGSAMVRALVFEDDRHLLVGDDDGRLTRWALSEPPLGEEILSGGGEVRAVSPLGDGRIAVARGEEVDLLHPSADGREIVIVSKGLGAPTALAVSNDRRMLAVGFVDGAMRVWALDGLGRAPVMLRPHKDAVRSLAFDRAGRTLVSVGDDGFIRSSIVGGGRLAEIACGLAWRDLTADEIREFFGGGAHNAPDLPGMAPPGRGVMTAKASVVGGDARRCIG